MKNFRNQASAGCLLFILLGAILAFLILVGGVATNLWFYHG